MEFNSIEDAIKFAIEKEQEAAAFYRQAVTQESLAVNQKVLEDFALEEDKHAQMLHDFAADPTAIGRYQFQKITDLKRADYMVEIDFQPGMGYYGVIRIAMKLEEKANKMYIKMAEAAESEDTTNVFLILAQEEMKHKKKLETIYDDHLARTGD
jgi:rubrerythrin